MQNFLGSVTCMVGANVLRTEQISYVVHTTPGFLRGYAYVCMYVRQKHKYSGRISHVPLLQVCRTPTCQLGGWLETLRPGPVYSSISRNHIKHTCMLQLKLVNNTPACMLPPKLEVWAGLGHVWLRTVKFITPN